MIQKLGSYEEMKGKEKMTKKNKPHNQKSLAPPKAPEPPISRFVTEIRHSEVTVRRQIDNCPDVFEQHDKQAIIGDTKMSKNEKSNTPPPPPPPAKPPTRQVFDHGNVKKKPSK